jgi:hypothetical protein
VVRRMRTAMPWMMPISATIHLRGVKVNMVVWS